MRKGSNRVEIVMRFFLGGVYFPMAYEFLPLIPIISKNHHLSFPGFDVNSLTY
jgi:hypothetical protein